MYWETYDICRYRYQASIVMIMFEHWGTSEWILLFFECIAIAIIISFLVWKIKSKLKEVELRHEFTTQQRLEGKKAQQKSSGEN